MLCVHFDNGDNVHEWHVAAVTLIRTKVSYVLLRGAHAPLDDVYVYPQYTGIIAICAARTMQYRLWYFGGLKKN